MTRSLLIFDMDGTLTLPTQAITEDVKQVLLRCKQRGFEIALVSGSKYEKIRRQINDDCMFVIDQFDYVFAENGTQYYRGDALLKSLDITDVVPEATLRAIVEFSLRYIADLEIPVKRGTFIEHRKSLINICPVGRNCSMEERKNFAKFDREHNIRQNFIKELDSRFNSKDVPLSFVAGGEISIDVYPETWNKSISLSHVGECGKIHFFGDNTKKGGNDYEIYNHPDVVGHTVKDYHHLLTTLDELLAHK
ncbi:phosphomannomutase [Babesia ovis]|uniref:Phosphomannomutase n=1 Tax=Babesia ovis TaxID=5869 RepID=A0A9W5TA18_BABOV|nr:phosphomannomutase [Babesia ovis]